MTDTFQDEFKSAFEAATGETPKDALDSGFDGVDPNIVATAATALQAYAASPEGKAALANADGLPPDALAHLLGFDQDDSWFQTLIADIQQYNPIKAVSLGIMGQVEIVVGVSGTAGFAVDINASAFTGAVYAGGGVVEGADAGGQIDLCLGLWTIDTKDIRGRYVGVEADITDVVGMEAVAFGNMDDKDKIKDGALEDVLKFAKMIFVGAGIGVDDGVEGDEYYFFSGHLSKYPAFQSGSYDHMVMLQNMECLNKQDAMRDTVHMLYTVDGGTTKYRYPMINDVNMDSSDNKNWQCGNMIKFDDRFDITLYVNGDEIDTKTYHRSDFGSLNDKVKHDFDHSHLGNEVEYTIEAQLIASS